MTEADAKKLWCHRLARQGEPHPNECCIGAACAAWRWTPMEQTEAWERHVQAQMDGARTWRNDAEEVVRRNGRSMFCDPNREQDLRRTEGFCGLAGQP